MSAYLRELERLSADGERTVSAKRLAKVLHLTDTNVRKDLTRIGQSGRPGVGYDVEELLRRIREVMGTLLVRDVILVGVGNLGHSLLHYKGFIRRGFRICAAFDKDPEKIGTMAAGVPVLGTDQIERMTREKGVAFAIIATPPEAAQEAADSLMAAGIRQILNLAPANLTAPKDVHIETVDLAMYLEQLSLQANSRQ